MKAHEQLLGPRNALIRTAVRRTENLLSALGPDERGQVCAPAAQPDTYAVLAWLLASVRMPMKAHEQLLGPRHYPIRTAVRRTENLLSALSSDERGQVRSQQQSRDHISSTACSTLLWSLASVIMRHTKPAHFKVEAMPVVLVWA